MQISSKKVVLMNINELETALVKTARSQPSDGHVPYAFEKRIMSRLTSAQAIPWFACGKSLWRAALACVVVTLLCGLWSFSAIKQNNADTFSQSFESAVYADIDQNVENSW